MRINTKPAATKPATLAPESTMPAPVSAPVSAPAAKSSKAPAAAGSKAHRHVRAVRRALRSSLRALNVLDRLLPVLGLESSVVKAAKEYADGLDAIRTLVNDDKFDTFVPSGKVRASKSAKAELAPGTPVAFKDAAEAASYAAWLGEDVHSLIVHAIKVEGKVSKALLRVGEAVSPPRCIGYVAVRRLAVK